jgi:hypothetical protein
MEEMVRYISTPQIYALRNNTKVVISALNYFVYKTTEMRVQLWLTGEFFCLSNWLWLSYQNEGYALENRRQNKYVMVYSVRSQVRLSTKLS